MSQTSSGAEPERLPLFSLAIVGLAGLLVFFGNLRFGSSVLAVGFEDDFFYYAQVARNLAQHGRSTFDGIHLSNGYHPLWLLVLTLLTWLFSPGGLLGVTTGLSIALAIETVQLALLLAIAILVYRIARLYASHTAGIVIQLLMASFAMMLLRTGMEVGLTMFLAFGLLYFRLRTAFCWTAANAFFYGLITSLMVLSRLDAVLLAAMLFVFDVLQVGHGRQRMTHAASFICGTFPIAVYLALNEWIFHTLTPVSGMAKQLRHHHQPSLRSLHSFAGFLAAPASPLLGLFVLLTLAGIAFAFSRRNRWSAGSPGVVFAFLLFAPVQLLATTSLSDWQLWPWYLYPWVLSGTLAAVLMWPRGLFPTRWLSLAATSCAIFFLTTYAALVAHASSPAHNLTYVAGSQIRHFALSHPGIYAMGDRAGAPGYLAPVPVLQLEGLMMDKPYLANIKDQRDLLTVLHEYGVDYYIATRAAADDQGCYLVKEPWQAGPDSPAMHGRICAAPVAQFGQDPFVNDIFDLKALREKK